MNNRLWNVKNPNQGSAKKVLCVCSAGLLRSPTAAVVFASYGKYNTRAVGTATDFALIPIDNVLLEWADIVVCMEFEQARVVDALGFEGDIYCLNISDQFGYMDPELVEILKERYTNLSVYKYN